MPSLARGPDRALLPHLLAKCTHRLAVAGGSHVAVSVLGNGDHSFLPFQPGLIVSGFSKSHFLVCLLTSRTLARPRRWRCSCSPARREVAHRRLGISWFGFGREDSNEIARKIRSLDFRRIDSVAGVMVPNGSFGLVSRRTRSERSPGAPKPGAQGLRIGPRRLDLVRHQLRSLPDKDIEKGDA